MYPLVVDTKFKTTNTNITVNTVDDGIFSLLPESWKIEWTVGGKDGNGFTDLEAARKTASLFKDPIARVGTGAAKTSGINGPNGRVITLNLGALQVENEGSANFNLKYVPFSLNSADKWTGFNALNKQNGLPVWIIRNGINDQAQNSNTDFSSPGTDWAGTKNGNGAVAFKVKTTAVTGITLDKTSLSVAAGQTFTLVPTITPANATNTKVTWSSDTKSVATVNSSTGLVTVNTGATATATTTITATTQDGNKTAECLVTVIIPVTDIENVPTGTDYVAAKYQGFTKYIVKPYNATYQTVGWSVKNGGGTGAYFDGDTLFVSNWGTVTVTATIANGKGLQDYTQDFDILFRDRILITSLTIDDITIYISQHGGLPSAAYHVQPPDADTDILWDMLYTPDTQGIVDFHKTKDVGVDHWEGLQVGKTRVWTWFRQFPQIPGCYFNLTVVN
jgi:hypothetical protein